MAYTPLDHRVRTFQSTSTSADRALVSNVERTGTSPLAAVRITGAEAPLVTSGFDVGFMGSIVLDLRRFPLGARVPCWVDPARAGRFTLVRVPSVSSVFVLAMLSVLAVVLMAIARGLRPGGTASARPSRRRRPVPRSDRSR